MAGTTHSFGITSLGIWITLAAADARSGRLLILLAEAERRNALFLVVGRRTHHAANTPANAPMPLSGAW
jgi:hypothetical protein